MAALALPTSRTLFHSLRLPALRPLFAAAFVPAFLTAPRPSSWTLPASLQSLLELFPPFLLAVPKKKTSHSRKSMRSANKGLKDKHSMLRLTLAQFEAHTNCTLLFDRSCTLSGLWVSEAGTPSMCELLLKSQSRVEGTSERGYSVV